MLVHNFKHWFDYSERSFIPNEVLITKLCNLIGNFVTYCGLAKGGFVGVTEGISAVDKETNFSKSFCLS